MSDFLYGFLSRKTLVRFGLSFAAITSATIAFHLSSLPNSQVAKREQYAVYSSYIEAGLTGDDRRFGDGGVVLVLADASVLSGENELKQFGTGLKALARLRRHFPIPVRLGYSFLWANLGEYKFEPKFMLSSKCVVVMHTDLSDERFHAKFPNSYSYFTFSPVGFNRTLDEAFFYAGYMCPLCGGGEYVLMKKVRGQWQTVSRYGVWVS